MNENVEMLNYIYQNAKMGKSTIDQIIKEVSDITFKDVLNEQLKDYEKVIDNTKVYLSEFNKQEKDITDLSKIVTYLSIKMSTLNDDTSSHIADMLIKGSTMGTVEITKKLNKYTNIDESIKMLASKLLKIEENNIEKLKKYL
ncbi:MAG: hypothetical protein RSC92_04820 [Clostridia bacterium]